MVKIKKLGILSVAKVQAIIGVVFGLIMGIFVTIITAAFSSMGEVSGLAGMGALSIIIMPIMYGSFGFIGGAIGAFIYNVVAGMVGGIEMELEQ